MEAIFALDFISGPQPSCQLDQSIVYRLGEATHFGQEIRTPSSRACRQIRREFKIPTMTQYLKTITLDAPPGRVWDVLSDVERWHEWTASISRIERLNALPVQVGARFRVKQPKLAANDWLVTMADPSAGFTWETRSAGTYISGEHLFNPIGNGTSVVLRLSFNGWLGKLMGRLGRTLILEYLDMEASGLKKAVESLHC